MVYNLNMYSVASWKRYVGPGPGQWFPKCDPGISRSPLGSVKEFGGIIITVLTCYLPFSLSSSHDECPVEFSRRHTTWDDTIALTACLVLGFKNVFIFMYFILFLKISFIYS